MLQVFDAHMFASLASPSSSKLLYADWTSMSQSLHATKSEVRSVQAAVHWVPSS